MSARRSAVHATLNSPRPLAVAAAVALGETARRIALALLGHPSWPLHPATSELVWQLLVY